MAVDLLTGSKRPKSVPVPVPGQAPEGEKPKGKGGRPPGSGKKDADDDSTAMLIAAGINMFATWRAEKKGPHWMSLSESSGEIGTLGAKVFEKYFPASKFTKYADEVRLLVLIGEKVGTPLMIDLMTAKDEPKEEKQDASSGSGSPGPSNVRSLRNESESGQPGHVHGVKHGLPALG